MASVHLQGIYHCYQKDSFELAIEDLRVDNGETLALVGESGCGKTTLLRAIAGLEAPQRGSIQIASQVVCDATTFVQPEKRQVGLVFQDNALFPHLTVKQNVTFGIRKLTQQEKESRFNEILELTHLTEFINRYPHELSGGQQQRVALARALVCKPNVLLLDEPFSNLDEPLKVRLRKEIKELISETKTTAILVSHDIRDAFVVADHIAILRNGRLEQLGTPDMLRNDPATEYVKALINAH